MSRTFKDKPYKVMLAKSGPSFGEPSHDHTPHKWNISTPVKDANGNPIIVETPQIVSYQSYEEYARKTINPRPVTNIPRIPNQIDDDAHTKTVWQRYSKESWGTTYYVRTVETKPLRHVTQKTVYEYDGCTIDVQPSEENNWGDDLPCHYEVAYYIYNPYRSDSFSHARKKRQNRRNRYIGREETRNLTRLVNNGTEVDDVPVTDYVVLKRNDWD